jgi:hypothetical protein
MAEHLATMLVGSCRLSEGEEMVRPSKTLSIVYVTLGARLTTKKLVFSNAGSGPMILRGAGSVLLETVPFVCESVPLAVELPPSTGLPGGAGVGAAKQNKNKERQRGYSQWA